MRKSLAFLLFVLALCLAHLPARVYAEGCNGQKWCVETSEFAFRLGEYPIEIDRLRHLEEKGAPDMASTIRYILQHPKTITYIGWIRPTPEMHYLSLRWNVGLQLKSGEVIWAQQWIYEENGHMVQSDPGNLHFSPISSGRSGENNQGKSYLAFVVFPERKADGKDWKDKEVAGLVFE
ncbi:MAG: hypothetical protein H6760_05135 [Candidatus Nomurabacteria bacterium]|nr:MAG: hypothetical protein H6760_05135 [Candidatus Nomurabacteria bacterium]